MSKGISYMNIFNPPLEDGHMINKFTAHGVSVYCAKIQDNVTGTNTSNGVKCTCGKTI